ncbi:sugar ABC transporter substrate-binding protein [Paenibacillus puerhi]|uniref:sugar ABC transporter substrate-binding protein n=1 Tax=Paenibacillus puerhi TaxID=2692622 RepID=UPI001F3B2CF3|nr:substrate-binding domain-containing protein [Paenibacillus puerhi]
MPNPALSSDKEKESSQRRTFGILYPQAHPFYQMITESLEAQAIPHSINLIVKAPDEVNLEQQMRMMETMIKQKVDGIALSPIDPEAMSPLIDKAVQAGIPVICFESDAPKSRRLSYIGSDPEAKGKLMGEIIDKKLKGKGMILIEGGLSRSDNKARELQAILSYLSNKTDVQVLEVRHHEGQQERALADLEEMIDAHPHFEALVTLDVISSSTSILVWKALGLKRNLLTLGMTPEVKKALENGQITSVISENEQQWGKLIIEKLLLASEWKELPVHVDSGLQEVTAADVSAGW